MSAALVEAPAARAVLPEMMVSAGATAARAAHVDQPAAQRSLLRFITCGSVDDGKSTLLGRLLHETGGVFEDQFSALERDSRKFGTTGEEADFALLVDGLSAEREQGITIDVAYRYFSTPRRSFIAADTPGHEQYTRNMATGASTADLAIILIDARKGLLPQTRRHSFIVSMMGVKHIVLAVNKMDLVDHDRGVFDAIERDYRAMASAFGKVEIAAIALSARNGDNVVARSRHMPWYAGPTLLELLETADVEARAGSGFRLPVQWVNRPNADFRGFAGTITGGEVRRGDAVTVLPAGRSTRIDRIVTQTGDLDVAVAGQSVTLTFKDEVDVSRGAVIASGDLPEVSRGAQATLLVVGETPIEPGRSYWLKLGTMLVPARIAAITHAIDVHSYEKLAASSLPMNGIGSVALSIETPIAIEPFSSTAELGSFILIDRFSNDTVALGVVTAVGDLANAVPGNALPAPAVQVAPGGLMDWLLQPDAEPRGAALARLLSWRLLSGIAVFLAVLALGGSVLLAAGVGLIDAIARTFLHRWHDLVLRRWQQGRAAKSDERLSSDGSDI